MPNISQYILFDNRFYLVKVEEGESFTLVLAAVPVSQWVPDIHFSLSKAKQSLIHKSKVEKA